MNKVKQWLRIVKSVMASFIGVQTQSNYDKDANMRSFVPFIVVGLIMAVVFVLTVWTLVNLLIASH